MERKKVEHVVRAAHNSSRKAMQSRYHLACSSHGSGSLITERARSVLARVHTHTHTHTNTNTNTHTRKHLAADLGTLISIVRTSI